MPSPPSTLPNTRERLSYWRTQLDGSHAAEFFLDAPRPHGPPRRSQKQEVRIEGSLHQDVQHYCSSQQVSLFAVLLTAFRVTHYRLNGVEDATVGAVHPKCGGLEGLQCLRIHIDEETSFGKLVQQIEETVADAKKYRIPMQNLLAELLPASASHSRHPFVQTVFSLSENGNEEDEGPRPSVDDQMSGSATSDLDLALYLSQAPDSLHGAISFPSELFHPRTISSIISVFYSVLSEGLANPQTPVASLLLGDAIPALREAVLLEPKRTDCARDSSVIDVFQRQAALYPDAVAVRDSNSSLTYTQLNCDSDILADWLRTTGVAPETLIGILAPRSCLAVLAMLGILKANFAYMPLDVRVPPSRIETILSAVSGHKVILLGQGVIAPVIQVPDVSFISIQDITNGSVRNAKTLDQAIAEARPTATSLAYVMFTSGSTGKPKGVMIEHRGIVRMADFLGKMWKQFPVAQMANIAFDTSTSEIYTPLLNGGTVVCIDDMTALDSVGLGDVFAKEGIEVAVFPPALLKQCLVASPSTIQQLQVLFVAGDRLDARDVTKTLELVNGDVYNSYGPTENSVLSTLYCIERDEKRVNGVPIGQAISNSGAHVMDPRQRLVPIGVLGELVVTGDGLARGYTDPACDVDRFVTVEIGGQMVRAYRTGDYVRHRPKDGLLEFFGRMDYQVKIRGNRVELPEVEQALLASEAVSDAVTLVRNAGEEDADLVSFVTISDSQELSKWEEADDGAQDQVQMWREHFDVTAFAGIDNMDQSKLGRDFVGWTSMYDGTLINGEEMEEWLNDTIKTLLDGHTPRNVLEVGTGSGMVLFNLPASIESYVGLEIAAQAVAYANKAAASVLGLQGKVQVRVGTVEDVGGTDKLNKPDLVVINSVAQYFPTPEYLLKAIEDLLRLGSVERLFIGDVRSFALWREFQMAKAVYNAGDAATQDQIRQQMAAIERAEEELLVDPAFFTSLVERLPDLVGHVEILPKKMKATNELSAYRYAAVVHSKRSRGQSQPILTIDEHDWIDFESHDLDNKSLSELLSQDPSKKTMAISNIPHRKSIFERCALDALDGTPDANIDHNKWLSSCRATAENQAALSAVELHEVARLANRSVEVSWARQRSQRGGLDAVFHRLAPQNGSRVLFRFPTDHAGRSLAALTNQPLQQRTKQKLEEQLRNKLKAKLPSYMVPSVIRILDKMPINANGKVDRKALANNAQLLRATRSASKRVMPRTGIERALCEEFSSVLGEELGMTDSFSDLGGHSLQAARLVTQINHRFGCKLYVFDLLKAPTPAAIAELISTKTSAGSTAKAACHSELHRRPNSRATIVLIHGLWGQGSVFAPMIPMLDDSFDVLIVHDPFFGQPTGPKSIRQWAERYLEHVESQISPVHQVILGGYSLGGLIAYEMASLWRTRYDSYPASLVLLDPARYEMDYDKETEIKYGLKLFGESQKQLVLDHVNKIAPLTRDSARAADYTGRCLYLTTPESVADGTAEWWTAHCHEMQIEGLECTHYELLGNDMIERVGRLIDEFCCRREIENGSATP